MATVVARALADVDEAEAPIKRDGGGIVPVDFEEYRLCSPIRRLAKVLIEQSSADALATRSGFDGDGQNFCLVRC